MGNKTIYVEPEDEAVVARAVKLLAFHEDKSLSALPSITVVTRQAAC
jgi:hypothetical protein